MSENKRPRQISFRVTETEFQRLQAFARHAGLRQTEMARRLVTQGSHEVAATREQRLDPAFIKRLDGIGLDLKKLLTIIPSDPSAAAGITAVLEDIRAIIKAAVLERVD